MSPHGSIQFFRGGERISRETVLTFIVPANLGLSLTNEAAVAPVVEVFSQTIENFTASSISAELPQTDFSATPSQGETGDSDGEVRYLEVDNQLEEQLQQPNDQQPRRRPRKTTNVWRWAPRRPERCCRGDSGAGCEPPS